MESHALEWLDHEQTQTVVDDLLEALARVDASVHRGCLVPAGVELALNGHHANARGAVVTREGANEHVEEIAHPVHAVRG